MASEQWAYTVQPGPRPGEFSIYLGVPMVWSDEAWALAAVEVHRKMVDDEAQAEIERLAAMVVTLEKEKAALLGKLAELHEQRRTLREAMMEVLDG